MLTEVERLELIGRLDLGESIRALSRATGRSRNTIRKYLRNGTTAAKRKIAAKRVEKLDPYKDYILERLENPTPEKITAAGLYREVKELGYSGGLTRLKEFVRQFGQQSQPIPAVPEDASSRALCSALAA